MLSLKHLISLISKLNVSVLVSSKSTRVQQSPIFDDDKTPYQKIKEKFNFNFKTPLKHMHNENLKIWAEFLLKIKETL